MNAQEIISSGILELYCMGLTSAAETAEVAAWAKQYPEVAAEIEVIQSGLESYAQTHAVAPAASVKEKLFAAINTNEAAPVVNIKTAEKTTAKVYSISPAWKYAAAASVILLVGSLLLNYTFYNKYQSANKELASTQNELQQQITSAQSMDSAIDIMGDMHATQVVAKSVDTTADMGARIYWMKNTHEVYVDPANLPKAPEGKQYEFWAIVEGAPVNGGVITTEINGKKVHVQKMKSFGKVQAFAISLEDAGPAKSKTR
ncbi:MAG: anti-sigma factor [Chitinophagaceae bacterium]|nr:anti-sigma factor [Chitinophagaceae bacterium]